MNVKTRILTAAIAAASVLGLASAARAAGTTSAIFLEAGVGARAEAMGGAYVALSNDANGINSNPAGMVRAKGQMATVMHNETVFDISQDNLAYVNGREDHAYGASLIYYDLGTQSSYSTTGAFTGTFNASDWALAAGYAKRFDESLSWGVNLKYIKEDIATFSDNTFAADLGLMYRRPNDVFSYGLAVRNIGQGLQLGTTRFDLPLTLRGGVAYHSAIMPLIVSAELVKIKDVDTEFHLGAEYLLMSVLALRAGYNSADDLDNGFTFGVGFRQKTFDLDYAFVPYGVFGDSHRLAYSMKF